MTRFAARAAGFSKAAVAALALLAATPAARGEAVEWRLASGFDDTVFHTRNLREFAATVNSLAPGQLLVSVHARGTLLPLGAIKNGVVAGEAQLGEVLLSDLATEDALFEVDAVPFLAPNYAKAELLWDASREAIAERFASQGLVVLFAVPWPPQGLFSKQPLARMDDVAGRGMRVYNGATARFAELIGATPLTLATRELGEAMAGDKLQLMVLPASTGARIDAPYYFAHYYDAQAWLPKNLVVVNAEALAALEPAVRDALFEAARLAEANGWKLSRREHIERTAALRLRGAKVSALPVELKREFYELGRQMTFDWTQRAGESAVGIVERYYALQ